MSEQQNFGFGKFVPGFDFLQNLSKGTPQQQAMPNLSSWVAPTLNVEELEKRIGELKAVSFWLDQNAKALAATIQALELQKMTLATLKGMNFNMSEIADALKLKPSGTSAAAAADGVDRSTAGDGSVAGAAKEAVAKARAKKKDAATAQGDGQPSQTGAAGVVDPMQWWGALTTQFQEIAAGALREAAKAPAVAPVTPVAPVAPAAAKAAATPAAVDKKAAPARKSTAARAPARKSRPRTR
jgi:hypothetical protein